LTAALLDFALHLMKIPKATATTAAVMKRMSAITPPLLIPGSSGKLYEQTPVSVSQEALS
jgi:hypothetical protein